MSFSSFSLKEVALRTMYQIHLLREVSTAAYFLFIFSDWLLEGKIPFIRDDHVFKAISLLLKVFLFKDI